MHNPGNFVPRVFSAFNMEAFPKRRLSYQFNAESVSSHFVFLTTRNNSYRSQMMRSWIWSDVLVAIAVVMALID